MKQGKRVFAVLLAALLLLSALSAVSAQEAPVAAGWLESLYAQLPGVTDADVTAVTYSGAMSGALTGEDLTYLVRDLDGAVRVDIPGLKAGEYTLTVTAGGKDYVFDHLTVQAHDRSGFAHKVHTTDDEGNITAIADYTEGVGAYNDDGTLKDNALVLYVTEVNKEDVTLTAGGVTTIGIGNILNASGGEGEPGSGLTTKGGKANSNGGVLKKLGEEGRALVVRFVGNVSRPEGVSAFASIDYGGGTRDNGGMAGIREINNVTLEGIGPDAAIDGWGVNYVSMSDGAATGLGRNFEVRNLTFRNVPEDCIGINGTARDNVMVSAVEHCWVHNCAFYRPTVENPAEEDKAQGDGALDFKLGRYMTSSYNYFEGYHKTSLLGGGDVHTQYHITWHHNHYKDCESRCPLARQADMHIYNNYYEGQSSYCMSLRANCYIFSEGNIMRNCKDPFKDEGTGGVCKSYQDLLVGCTGIDQAVHVTDKAEKVTSANLYANFDTDPALSYIPAGDYKLDADAKTVMDNIRTYGGPQKAVTDADPAAIDPAGVVTRQQMAVALAGLAQSADVDVAADIAALDVFADGFAVEPWAETGVAWCVQNGILRGRGNGILDPSVAVSGAEAAVMFQRVTALLESK